jgi:hypothetical protein
MRKFAFVLIVPLCAGCRASPPDPEPMEATASIMAEVRPGMPLEEMLQILDSYLVSAIEGRMEGESVNDFRRAEAITDRLLEARLPFEWIAQEQYSLQSRLRQIQSRADRVLAQLETAAPRDTMLMDLHGLHSDVARLREAVAQGGTRAPPPIHRLLTGGGDTAGVGERRQRLQQQQGTEAPAQPTQPTGPRPLGTPVRPPGQ